MKLRNFLALMAIGCLSTGFTSCDDDDDDDAPAFVVLDGDFYGVNGQTVMGSTSFDSTCVTRVISQANGKYSVVLPESTNKVSEDGKAMPDMPTFTVKDLDLKAAANNLFTAEVPTITIKDAAPGKDANISNFKIAVDKSAKKVTLSYGLQYGKMPLTIENDFRTLTQNDFLVGDFFGNNAAHVGDTQMPDSAVIATIALQENGKYAVSLPAKSKEAKGMEMPAVTVKDVEIKAAANVYTFAIEETTVKTPGMDILLKGMKGEVYGNKFTLVYDMKPGKMPMFVSNDFEGGKLAK